MLPLEADALAPPARAGALRAARRGGGGEAQGGEVHRCAREARSAPQASASGGGGLDNAWRCPLPPKKCSNCVCGGGATRGAFECVRPLAPIWQLSTERRGSFEAAGRRHQLFSLPGRRQLSVGRSAIFPPLGALTQYCGFTAHTCASFCLVFPLTCIPILARPASLSLLPISRARDDDAGGGDRSVPHRCARRHGAGRRGACA